MTYDLLAWKPRQEAAERATAHADRENAGWGGQAYDALVSFLERRERFMTQDYVEAAIAGGLAEPPDRRAFGSVVSRAVKAGLIVREGFELDRFKSPKPVWRRR